VNPKRKLMQVTLGLALLGTIAIGIANRPLRIWYHRMRLRQDLSFRPVSLKRSEGPLTLAFWRWRLLEGGRNAREQMKWRQEVDAPRQIAALERLGFYVRREFFLVDRYDPLPDWLLRLSDTTLEGVNKGADWPVIRFEPTTSNTVLVRITGTVPLVQTWTTTVHEHGGR
jgi:hypothetical protein